ncbi:MAG: HD domain-containing protein [Clostridia bacterium]|nr:HD domain-containing protein [Clostridia bacterium]
MNNHSSKTVLDFYYLTNNLKTLVRSGWKQWNVSHERLESVAEHIFSTCMLAIAIDSEFEYSIDLRKVILMLAVHELEEILISDITPFDGVSAEDKLDSGHQAVHKLLSPLLKAEEYEKLILEFDGHETPEAQFAYMCDKLDANLMALYYDRDLTCTFENASEKLRNNPVLQEITAKHHATMGECFYQFEQTQERLDKNFNQILDEARTQFILLRAR